MSDLEINAWSAKECSQSIEYYDYPKKWMWQAEGAPCLYWDFRDPRCMAVIRGHFNIRTNYDTAGFAHSHCANRRGEGIAESPHEADCACLVKIWEASNE